MPSSPRGDGRFPAPGLGERKELAGVDLSGRSPGPGQFLFELVHDLPGVIAGAMFPGDSPEALPGLYYVLLRGAVDCGRGEG